MAHRTDAGAIIFPAGARRLARPLARALIAASAWLLALPHELARACPDCAIGRAARAQVYEREFAFNLVAALAPFVFIVAASIAVERIGRPSNRREE